MSQKPKSKKAAATVEKAAAAKQHHGEEELKAHRRPRRRRPGQTARTHGKHIRKVTHEQTNTDLIFRRAGVGRMLRNAIAAVRAGPLASVFEAGLAGRSVGVATEPKHDAVLVAQLVYERRLHRLSTIAAKIMRGVGRKTATADILRTAIEVADLPK